MRRSINIQSEDMWITVKRQGRRYLGVFVQTVISAGMCAYYQYFYQFPVTFCHPSQQPYFISLILLLQTIKQRTYKAVFHSQLASPFNRLIPGVFRFLPNLLSKFFLSILDEILGIRTTVSILIQPIHPIPLAINDDRTLCNPNSLR